jgi:Protein of unknown function (DUF2806)
MSGNPTNITVAGDWSRPATALIEKIADAVGGLTRPYQVVRVAKAEAKASHIRAKAEIEVKSLERRATRRFIAEEAKKQANMEQIIRDALPLLEEKAEPENVDDDWITNLFEKARIISDEEMQRLWSMILAGEANSPGTFSRGTVNLLSNLDKTDAQLFTNLCALVWTLGAPPAIPIPLVADQRAKIYNDHGVNFGVLSHLESLGLIRFDVLQGFVMENQPGSIQASYFGKTLALALPNSQTNTLRVGQVLLTRAGIQLARICTASPVEGLFDYVREYWQNLSYIPRPTQATPAEPAQEAHDS